MSFDVLNQLVKILAVSKHSLQIDESLLLRYVRFIHDFQAQEEMLFAINLPADTREKTVFNAVEGFYEEKEIPMQDCIAVCSRRCRCNGWKYQEFIALMKNKIPGLIATHSVIHRQHLGACNLNAVLHHCML